MKRKIEKALDEWSHSRNRKPLIVNGARQTGKTYSIVEFARKRYTGLLHIDFSAEPDVADIFAGDITPQALIPQLQARYRTEILPEHTLLFFDEIQRCERALASLKYFQERASEYQVACAGSLLGITLNRKEQSFPVGKVDMLALHPLDFEEYLWALGEQILADLIREKTTNTANTAFGLHEQALGLLYRYLFTGGMPEAVRAEAEGEPAQRIRTIQATLNDAYVADMTKYAAGMDAAKILAVWRGVPEQLAKENHKFQYATIASSARAHAYEAAIYWLESAGLITPCYRVREAAAPLKAFAEHDFFKLYLHDVGLLSQTYDAEPADFMPSRDKAARFRGGLMENYVMQQLVSVGLNAFYWGTASRNEVDFIIRDVAGDIIPLEVKSGSNVSSASLDAYRRNFAPPYAIRLSTKNYGEKNGIRSIPLYAAFCLR